MTLSRWAGFGAVLALCAVVTLGGPATAQDVSAGSLTIHRPWTRATPGGADVAGGYLTVTNAGTTPDRLVGGSLAAATGFGLHAMSEDGGIMRMRPTGPLTIAPGSTLTLAPSGLHIMYTGLKRGLKRGDSIDGTLVFEHAGTVGVRFRVESIGAKGPDRDDTAMPGMTMD